MPNFERIPQLILTGLVLLAAACERAEASPEPDPAPIGAPAPTKTDSSPAGPPGLERIERVELTGTVAELLPAGGYNYLALRDEACSERWVVVANGQPQLGAPIRVRAFGRKHNFHSSRLDRDFPELLFAELIE